MGRQERIFQGGDEEPMIQKFVIIYIRKIRDQSEAQYLMHSAKIADTKEAIPEWKQHMVNHEEEVDVHHRWSEWL